MIKRILTLWIAPLILFVTLSGSRKLSDPNISYDTFAGIFENASETSYINNFIETAQTVFLNTGKSLFHSELIYTKTGVDSNAYAYGDMKNTAEYTIQNKEGFILETCLMHIRYNISGIILPDINYSENFIATLDSLGISDIVSSREDIEGHSKIINNEIFEIDVRFESSYTEPVDTDIEKADVSVYLKKNTEKEDDSGRIHAIYQAIILVFWDGKLSDILLSMSDKYEAHGEDVIKHDKVGIRFINPEYQGDDAAKVKLEEIYYDNGIIYVFYSVKTTAETEISASYIGKFSEDFLNMGKNTTHTVNGEKEIIDGINISRDPPPDINPNLFPDLYKDYYHFRTWVRSSIFVIVFSNGSLRIPALTAVSRKQIS